MPQDTDEGGGPGPLLVDKRTGSGELVPYLQALGLPAVATHLHFADMAFLGNGLDEEGEEALFPIGVERKALGDFVSSVLSGRLAGHQLTGLLNSYRETWVVIEGDWRIDTKTGHVQVLKWEPKPGNKKPSKKLWTDVETGTDHALAYREFEAMILTLELKGGVRIRHTRDKMATCRFLHALYHWWTDKTWLAHRSHLRFHSQFADKNLLVPPSYCRELAAVLPGIGFEKSGAVAQFFQDVPEAMAYASPAMWAAIPGIGKTMADRIVAVWKGTVKRK